MSNNNDSGMNDETKKKIDEVISHLAGVYDAEDIPYYGLMLPHECEISFYMAGIREALAMLKAI
tara:strand:+ start:589 stop:780 length:192 start_codon:yes stop_codon:yes gene_type:complete